MKIKQKIQIIVGCMLLCILPVLNAQAQWVKSDSNAINARTLAFSHPTAAYCGGGGGNVYKSIDSGKTWQQLHDFGPFTTIRKIVFLNADTGFVQQYHAIQRTYDGGVSWQSWNISSIYNTRNLYNIGSKLYFSTAENDTSYIFQSLDYGASFQVIHQHYELNASPLHVSFYKDSSAYLLDGNNNATGFVTHDNFATLDTFTLFNAPFALEKEMVFMDSTHGFLFGNTSFQSQPIKLWKHPTGMTHNYLDLDGTGILPLLDVEVRLQGVNSKIYACSEYGKIFWSTNFGQSWVEQNTPVNTRVSSIAFANKDLGIAVTNDGIIYTKNGGVAPNGLNNQNVNNLFVLYPNPVGDELFILCEDRKNIKNIRILNSLGIVIKELNANAQSVQLDGLSPGVYFMIINTENGRAVKSFIKR